jgi:hypothetical protein
VAVRVWEAEPDGVAVAVLVALRVAVWEAEPDGVEVAVLV